MLATRIRRMGTVILCVGAGMLATGCNIQGLWADRQSPKGPVASTSDQQRGDVATDGVDLPTVDVEEVDLVEGVVTHRAAYHQALEHLRQYYQRHGYATKLAWAEFELQGTRNVKPFRYLLDAEVPSERLRSTDQIAEADALYLRGLDLMRRGGHGIPALFRRDLMIEAAELFRDLVMRFPTSDKIDDAAFQAGEIHKEYLPRTETIAVDWYRRAWTWDARTPHPARFQAAVVYDYRLHDRQRALELYQFVVKGETRIESNVRFAMRRIYELTRDVTARADAR